MSVLVGILLLCMAVVAGVSLILIHRISGAGNEISKSWLPSVTAAEEINSLTQDFRMNEQGYILASTGTMRQKYKDQLDKIEQKIGQGISAYQSTAKDENDQKLMEKAKEKWDQYVQLSEQMLSYIDQNQSVQAQLMLNGQSSTVYDDIAYSCKQLVDFNKSGAKQASDRADSLYTASVVFLLGLLAVAFIFGIVLAVYIARMIVRPIRMLRTATEAISQGNLDVQLESDISRDELGQITTAFSFMSNSLKIIIEDMKYLLGEMADGNFTLHISNEEHYIGVYQDILHSIQRLNRNLNTTLVQINTASELVAMGAGQVSGGAQAFSHGATEQASAIEELSASIAEISAQVKRNAQHALQASKSADAAGHELESSNTQMKSMVTEMEEINTRSREISKITKTIEDIAFQTNILALNAAVEAARAGTAGKGFAVVADEVRNLASKSAEAAGNTAKLIQEALEAVKKGYHLAASTADLMEKSAKSTKEAVSLIDAIAVASEQQAQSISQVDLGVGQIASVVQINSATAEESAAASVELSDQAQMLKCLVDQFRLCDENSGEAAASKMDAAGDLAEEAVENGVVATGEGAGRRCERTIVYS